MIRTVNFLIYLLLTASVFTQVQTDELGIKAGQNFSTFLFRSDKLDDLDYKYRNGSFYGMDLSFKLNDRNFLRTEIVAYQAGSQAIYGGNTISWRLNYIGLGAGYLVKLIDQENRYKFSFSAGVQLGIDYMISGQQNVNKLNYDLKEVNAFHDFHFHGSPFVRAKFIATPRMNLSMEYRFAGSMVQIEGEDKSNGQKTYNLGHIVCAGVSWNMR
jgi:hypothetical protein